MLSPGSPCSEYLRRRNEGLQWEGFAENEGFKAWSERVSGWSPNNSKYDCLYGRTTRCKSLYRLSGFPMGNLISYRRYISAPSLHFCKFIAT